MIKIKLFKQSKGYCGPACLKMILSFYGIEKSEKELAMLTKTTRDGGCSEEKIIKTAKMFGLSGYVKQKSSVDELKYLFSKGSLLIVDWFSPEEAGHYSVVAGFEKNKIIIADPHFGKFKKHDIKWFEERWFDVVKDELILREVIVITN